MVVLTAIKVGGTLFFASQFQKIWNSSNVIKFDPYIYFTKTEEKQRMERVNREQRIDEFVNDTRNDGEIIDCCQRFNNF